LGVLQDRLFDRFGADAHSPKCDATRGLCRGWDRRSLNAAGYGSTVCINITSYADHSDRLK